MGTGALSQKESGQGVKLTTHLYLMLRLRMHGAISLSLHMSSWHCV